MERGAFVFCVFDMAEGDEEATLAAAFTFHDRFEGVDVEVISLFHLGRAALGLRLG